MTTNRTLRVLIADDHLLVREGLTRLINEQPDMTVVAEAGDGREALRLAHSHQPDVALVDISMAGCDGVTVAREFARTVPEIRIVAVTRHNDAAFVKKMFAAGAAGYVLKQSTLAELVRAIRTVVAGDQYVDPAIRMPIRPSHAGPADVSSAAARAKQARTMLAHSIDDFRDAHQRGMAALRRHDYSALSDAIAAEAAAIDKQASAVEQFTNAADQTLRTGDEVDTDEQPSD